VVLMHVEVVSAEIVCPLGVAWFLSVSPSKFKTIYLYQVRTPWSESVSEIYRPSDRRLSAK
jgi:hypothetical protein